MLRYLVHLADAIVLMGGGLDWTGYAQALTSSRHCGGTVTGALPAMTEVQHGCGPGSALGGLRANWRAAAGAGGRGETTGRLRAPAAARSLAPLRVKQAGHQAPRGRRSQARQPVGQPSSHFSR